MAGYLGYALQAGVQGFQSGFNMAQQKQEMKWKKAQMKKLEEKELKIQEGAALYSNLIKQYGADGMYSEDEIMQLNTAFLSAGYEVQAVIKDTHNAIQTMDKNKLEQDFAWLEMFADMTEGLSYKDIQSAFDTIKGNIKSEKGLNLFDAYFRLQEKRHEIAKEEEPWKRAAVLPAEVRPGYLRQEGVEIPEAEPTVKAPTFNEKRFNWKIEQYNKGNITLDQLLESEGIDMLPEKATGLEKQIKDIKAEGARAGINPAKINKAIQDKILGKPTTETPISFKTLQTIKDSFKNVKTRAEYDEALASYNTSKEARTSDWTPPSFEGQLTDLIKKVENALWADYVNKDGKLKSKADAEEYNRNLQHYLRLIEEAKNAGIDVSRFQAFIPYKSLYGGFGDPLVTSESW